MTKKFYNIEGLIRNGFKLSRNYQALDFHFTKLGDAGVTALAKSRSVRQLRSLIIPVQKLGPDSAKAIAESENLSNLQFLKLYRNKIGDEGVGFMRAYWQKQPTTKCGFHAPSKTWLSDRGSNLRKKGRTV